MVALFEEIAIYTAFNVAARGHKPVSYCAGPKPG